MIAELMSEAEWAEAEAFASALSAHLNSEHRWDESFSIEFDGHNVRNLVYDVMRDGSVHDESVCEIWTGRFGSVVKISTDGWDFSVSVRDQRPYDPRHVAAAARARELWPTA